MTLLSAKYKEHAQQLAAAEDAALHVEHSAAELEVLRQEQHSLSERIALLQGLLKVRGGEEL